MIKKHWIRRYTELPSPVGSPFILQSWDTAAKGGPDNDWSVCTTWLKIEQRWYLLDVYRARVDYPTLKAKDEAHALQSDGSAGFLDYDLFRGRLQIVCVNHGLQRRR